MSMTMVAWVRDNFKGSGSEKLVMMTLASYANAEGKELFPKHTKLAEHTGLSKRQVERIISGLKKRGVIIVSEYRYERHLSNKYEINTVMDDAPGMDDGGPPTPTTGPLVTGDETIVKNLQRTLERPPAGRPARIIDMKAEEIAKALQDEPTLNDREMVDKLDLMGQTLDNMTKVWRGTCTKHHEMYIPEFTKQELGQFTHFLKRAPQGRQLSVMAYALRHWDRFIVQLSREFGWHKLPIKPRLGHLLKGVSVAVTMLENMPEDERGGLNENKGSQFYSDF